MSFELLEMLKHGPHKEHGDNLNYSPSRITPISMCDNISAERKDTIRYVPPRVGNEYIVCNKDIKLPEPSAYFSSPNSFIKSYLYLTNEEFYENIHLPEKVNRLLLDFLRKISLKYQRNRKYKKLIQKLMNNLIPDTDPLKNDLFEILLELVEKDCNIEVIRSNIDENYLEHIKSSRKRKKCYLFLQYPTGIFSPYGTLYQK